MLEQDLYDENGALLLARGARLTPALLQQLFRRRIRRAFVRRLPEPTHFARVRRLREALAQLRNSAPRPVHFSPEETFRHPRFITPRTIDEFCETLATAGQLSVPASDAEALIRFMKFVDALRARAARTKEEYLSLYRQLIGQTERIFANLRRRQNVNGEIVLAMTEQVISALVADRELLLGTIAAEGEGEKDYLSRHAVNVSIIAANIAAAAGLSAKHVAEAAYGALLADVGMLGVPDAIRFKNAALSADEQLEVMRHTIYGIDRLQCVTYLPKTAALVAYQAHERLDGSGYPHGKRAGGIHDFAKITAIADVYHAQIARRPFRPQGRLPYYAVEEVLRMCGAKKLDQRFARALLSAVSLFPVGSWVRLNTGEIGQVLAAHRTEFTRPVVAILYDMAGRPIPVKRVSLFDFRHLHVVNPVHSPATPPLPGF